MALGESRVTLAGCSNCGVDGVAGWARGKQREAERVSWGRRWGGVGVCVLVGGEKEEWEASGEEGSERGCGG